MYCVLCKRQGIKTTVNNGKFCEAHIKEIQGVSPSDTPGNGLKDTRLEGLTSLLESKGILSSEERKTILKERFK
jgi:hypothetical protein